MHTTTEAKIIEFTTQEVQQPVLRDCCVCHGKGSINGIVCDPCKGTGKKMCDILDIAKIMNMESDQVIEKIKEGYGIKK